MRKLTTIILCALTAFAAYACSDSESFDKTDFLMTHTMPMIHGKSDTGVEHNAVVALYITKNTIRNVTCTGTLIHPQYVLTAAHCVTQLNESTSKMVASDYNRYIKIGVGNTITAIRKNLYTVASITWHPDYNMYAYSDANNNVYPTIPADIALIKLETPIPENVAKPILTMPPSLTFNVDADGECDDPVTFSGFGYDQYGEFGTKLKFDAQIKLYCSSQADPGCALSSPIMVSGTNPGNGTSVKNAAQYVLMPAGSVLYDQSKGGPCQGDSGGPMFIHVNGQEYLAGVTSYGDEVCAAYGISTATRDYFSWIINQAPEIAELYDEGETIADTSGDKSGTWSSSNSESFEAASIEICDNDIDDNDNGLIDCDDPQCNVDAACSFANFIRDLASSCSVAPQKAPTTPWWNVAILLFLALTSTLLVIRKK